MGAILQGVSAALHEQITTIDGEVQESNFDTYRVIRMSEAPELHLKIMPTDNPPAGVGEVGVPPVATCYRQCSGASDRRQAAAAYAFLPERVLAALAGSSPNRSSD